MKIHDPDTPITFYKLGCMSALTGDRREALDRLGQLIESGYSDAESPSTDTDLASVRGDPEFDRFVAAEKRNAGANP